MSLMALADRRQIASRQRPIFAEQPLFLFGCQVGFGGADRAGKDLPRADRGRREQREDEDDYPPETAARHGTPPLPFSE